MRWVVIHTAEGARTADDLRAFFNRSTTVSVHAIADDATLLDNLVPYDRAAWTMRNGNPKSDNLELCGFAKWSRDEWLNNHQGMLNNAATWIRNRCHARGIPIRKIDADAVRRGESGVIGHVDYTNGTGDGTHWDPGPGFPWDVVISRAAGSPSLPIPKEALMGSDPKFLPHTVDWEQLNFPVESGTLAVGDMWFTLSSSFGDTEYMLILEDGQGHFLGAAEGSKGMGNWGKEESVASGHREWFKLPREAATLSLRYRNMGTESRAGYAFPQTAPK